MIITIDGPAGTGKTTVARQVAERLGFQYFDTGAMYRAVTYQVLLKGINIQDTSSLEQLLNQFHFDIQGDVQKKKYFIDHEDVTEKLRTREVTGLVSEVSAHPSVRNKLVHIQREFGKGKNSVFEGRDMGTIVFPKADLKIFLTARPAVRAERRYMELKGKNFTSTEEDVLAELLKRDHFDSTREIAPLKQADDAHLIDTSDLTIEQVVDLILAFTSKKR